MKTSLQKSSARNCILWGILLIFLIGSCNRHDGEQTSIVLVVHGGAGNVAREKLSEGQEQKIREAMADSLKAGFRILKNKGASLDAVKAAIAVLEDNPLFNAGKGAVFSSNGVNELDASIMDGRNRGAGAVAGVRHVRNPILLADAVLNYSDHVLLTGEGAEMFAREQGLQMVEDDYFFSSRRWDQLQKAKQREADETTSQNTRSETKSLGEHRIFSTVGAVALDTFGNMAAGTSTGGLTNKKFGRVGDSPIIGAGTWADNETCAVSATGEGEYFIRNVIAYDIHAMLAYRALPLKTAADLVVMHKLTKRGGQGGVIAVDKKGNVAMSFNMTYMARGVISDEGRLEIKLFQDK